MGLVTLAVITWMGLIALGVIIWIGLVVTCAYVVAG